MRLGKGGCTVRWRWRYRFSVVFREMDWNKTELDVECFVSLKGEDSKM